jgi:hypothetical protein
VRPSAQGELPIRARSTTEKRLTLVDHVMNIMNAHRDSALTRESLVDLVSAIPALSHVADSKKSAQTVVARVVRDGQIVEMEDGRLVLPQDVKMPEP